MSQELFINVMSAEVRAALMDDGVLIDLIVERSERASVVGNIYLGRVERVMKGMEAAFVDIGLGKSGFLGLDDNRRGNGETSAPVHEGEAILVQVTKDAIGTKGVQLSRRLTLPGRSLVYAPNQDRVMRSTVSMRSMSMTARRPMPRANSANASCPAWRSACRFTPDRSRCSNNTASRRRSNAPATAASTCRRAAVW